MRNKVICALLIFIIAFGLRIPLVDTCYKYSFEPDSESCIAVTRSFYFFFKSPAAETVPQTLGHYPNYCDGEFITSALLANLIGPLCKCGIIKTPLSDSDNSLIIFSMRWAGVLFDATAAVFAFLFFSLLSEDLAVAVLLALLYYLLNPQTLNIDLIRIDHFTLFSANLTMLASALLFRFPYKKRYYILSGIAAGLVSATKLNFPFYLLVLLFVLGYLIYTKKASLKNMFFFFLAGLLSMAFMYQRWLMYPENIWDMISFTWKNGEEWTAFWGTDNRAYYMWGEFFNHGFSWSILALLLFAYASFIVCLVNGLMKRDALKIILCLTFVLQAIALAFSPKVGRYGTMMPFWLAIFMIYGVQAVSQYFSGRSKKITVCIALGLYLAPTFCYAFKDYLHLNKKSEERAVSIEQNRIAPLQWITKNVAPGSVIGIQHQRFSSPPVYDFPYIIEEQTLSVPFLFRDQVARFYPPDPDSIKGKFNYIILNDKETESYYAVMARYHCDSSLVISWRQFYKALDTLYPHVSFSSAHSNYGVKSVTIYMLNPVPFEKAPVIRNCKSKFGDTINLKWNVTDNILVDAYSFEIQVAKDSCFNWLVYGSRDGFESRYRRQADPSVINGPGWVYVPLPVKEAYFHGAFGEPGNKNNVPDERSQQVIQMFFWKLALYMDNDKATFRQAVIHHVGAVEGGRIIQIMNSAYAGNCPLLDCTFEAYVKLLGLKDDSIYAEVNRQISTSFSDTPHLHFKKGIKYYWRVRLRHKYDVISNWSSTNEIVI